MAARTPLTILATLGGVTANEIAANAVAASELADNAVDSGAIATGAIDSSTKIASGIIAASDIDLSGSFNFTGTLQKGGTDITPGQTIYFAVVEAATTGNVANLGAGAPDPVDGVSLAQNNDVLVWSQSTGSQNGIYNVDTVGTGSNGAWTRASERDSAGEYPVGMLVYVKGGTVHAQRLFKLTTFAGTLGTDTMTFEVQEEGMTVANSGEPANIGTGDGSTLNFDMGATGTVVAAAVFVDGILQPPANWAMAAGAGAGGVDQLQFGSGNAPPNGTAVEILAFLRS